MNNVVEEETSQRPELIEQLDGNVSFVDSDDMSDHEEVSSAHSFKIPVIYNFRLAPPKKETRNGVRVTVHRNKKLSLACSLPAFASFNMRSLWSKAKSLVNDMKDREYPKAILTEVWEKKKNSGHQEIIEELCQMKNIRYISSAGKEQRGVDVEPFS